MHGLVRPAQEFQFHQVGNGNEKGQDQISISE